MEVRPATSRDRSSIREVARDSFESSYALSPQEIEAILEDAFTPDALADRIDGSDVHSLVVKGESRTRRVSKALSMSSSGVTFGTNAF